MASGPGTLGRLAAALRTQLGRLVPDLTPAQEVQAAVDELKQRQQATLAALVDFKAADKQAGADEERLGKRVEALGKNAEKAVLAGDDALAKEALVERARVSAELEQVSADRRAAQADAAALLKVHRELAQRLTAFQLKQGTLAVQLEATRSSSGGKTKAAGPAWDAFERAEARIADADALAQLDAELANPEAEKDAEIDRRLAGLRGDDALAELKSKMERAALPAPTSPTSGDTKPKK
jgi:phage shock protein A